MEEDNSDGEDLTPFWVQSSHNLRRGDRLRRSVAAVVFSSGLVVFLLLVTAVIFLVFVVPSTLSFSANVFRPNSVKKSWDSLNVVLVLVAVVFGVLSRNKDNEFLEASVKENESKLNPSKLDYQNNLSLKRNSSSYPDLRESSYWGYEDYQRRYFDDIYVDSGRVRPDPNQIHHRRHRSLGQVDYVRETAAKTVIVDTLLSKSAEVMNPSPAAALPRASAIPEDEEIAAMMEMGFDEFDTGTAAVKMGFDEFDTVTAAPPPEESKSPEEENQRRSYERVARKRERSSRRRNKSVEPAPAANVTTPRPAPPPPEPKKKGGANFLNSLYNNKKKKQRQRSVDNLDSLLHEAEPPVSVQIPPSPPPPPPPPPSAFQNLFSSKKQKRKRTITVRLEPYPPEPPPPPPPPRVAARESQNPVTTTRKPPKPVKVNSFDEASNSGGESPFHRIPPPPPPPPPAFWKSPAWKFVVEGDYVRVNSSTSSRSGSPEPDETESDVTPSAADGGDVAAFHRSPLFCPSPDVDTKAESFITNFRAKLKLEKNDSMRKREPGLSGLGPGRV